MRYIRRFYDVFSKCPTMSDELSYSHYCEIIWFDENKMNYYIHISAKEKLSVRQLRNRIKNNEYERIDDTTKLKLINKEEIKVEDLVKNPIIINNINNYKVSPMATQLSSSHYSELLMLNNIN